MPKPSERQDLIAEVLDLLAVAILEEELDEELGGSSPFDDWEQLIPVDSSVDELFDLLQLILSRRYLSTRSNVQRSHEFAKQYFQTLPDDEFKQITRTSREAFWHICDEIKSHRIFHNNSKHQQAPVWLQLAAALDKLGTYGSGAADGRTKHVWGVGSGTIDLFTARVVIALNALTSVYVKWPDSDERRSMSRRMASEGFPGCVGFIDGTTFPLAQKPSVNGECYFDRKQRYSLNAQVVCDDRRRIIAFQCGWPGSCADSTVYRHMALAKDEFKGLFFSEGQYLIGDSAYPADTKRNTLVPAYKKNQHGRDNTAFNTCIAHVRVVNEHTIGVFKARWTSLREIRLQIKRKEGVERLLQWINACVVLHNILHVLGDGWPDEKEVDDQLPVAEGVDDDETFPFRRRLKEHAVAVGRQRDHILWVRGD